LIISNLNYFKCNLKVKLEVNTNIKKDLKNKIGEISDNKEIDSSKDNKYLKVRVKENYGDLKIIDNNLIDSNRSFEYNSYDKNSIQNNLVKKIITYSNKEIESDQIPIKSISSGLNINQQIYTKSDTYKKNLNKLLEGNNRARTWKEKLELVNSLILNDIVVKKASSNNTKNSDQPNSINNDNQNNKQILDMSSLSMISVYLFFLNNGQLKCAEDGTHFRPNHHANLAFSIYSFLLKNLDDSNSILIRSIFRNIPSFSDQYLAIVPLTRIRDIAHRNDIPQDLKQEIKHKLQNKLHRSASPDDLKTCEYLIDKIKNENYSQDFKKEFFIFYDELKEFFNALGVEKSLIRLKDIYKDSSAEKLIQRINNFLNLKNQINFCNQYEKNQKFIDLLYSTTFLRQEIDTILSREIDKIGSNLEINKTLLQLASTCDIELENYIFSTLSSFLNIIYENFTKNGKNVQLDEYHEKLFFDLSKICLRNLSISKVFKDETKYLEEDLEYFIFDKNIKLSKSVKLLRIKAVFERCLNLCYNLNNLILDCFDQVSIDIGKNMNINNESIKVYGEAFIRNHTIFQFSKIVSIVLNQIREELNLSPYIIISSGINKGISVHCKTLRDLEILIDSKFKNKENVCITAFLDEADGSEELPFIVKNVILGHDIPQLSHLAIRARQNNAVFISVLDKQFYLDLLNKFFVKKENYSNHNYHNFERHILVKGMNEISVKIEISNDDYKDFQSDNFIEDKINHPNKQINLDSLDNVNLNNLTIDDKTQKRKDSFENRQKNLKLEKDGLKNLSLLDIENADYDTCGSKSTNIKKLLNIKKIIENKKDFIYRNINFEKTGKNEINEIGFRIPYSVCIPFGIYEFYSRLLLNNSNHPNSEYSICYDFIDYDELINLEKNSIFFREKFIEHLHYYLNNQKEINGITNTDFTSTCNKDYVISKENNQNLYMEKEKNPSTYFDKLLMNIVEKTNNNIILKGNSNDKNSIENIVLLAFRSSSNLEDLNKNAGAGLFDSILGVPNNNPELIKKAILDVWSSLFTYRALITRRKIGILSKMAKMAILVQEMIHSEFSFVIHTCNPITKNNDEIFIEMAVGLGETLASANQKGSPYRLIYSKKNDSINIVNFSSFAFEYCVDIEENKENNNINNSSKIVNINKRVLYKNKKLSNDEEFITNIGIILGRIGVIIEENLNRETEKDKKEGNISPQDIEGAYAKNSIYIVQTRPQII